MAEGKDAGTAALAGVGIGGLIGASIGALLAARPARAAPSDEKLDYLIASQEVLITLLQEIRASIGQLLEKEGVPMEITKQVRIAYTVQPLETIKLAELSPLKGRIKAVTMHFPQNCNALVDVAFGHSEVWLIPSEIDTYIALNNATPTFPTDEPVEKGEHLWVAMRNGDGAEPHSISVIATVIGTEE